MSQAKGPIKGQRADYILIDDVADFREVAFTWAGVCECCGWLCLTDWEPDARDNCNRLSMHWSGGCLGHVTPVLNMEAVLAAHALGGREAATALVTPGLLAYKGTCKFCQRHGRP